MTPADAALAYAAARGWCVFPCQWQGPRQKTPLVANGFKNATRDEQQIRHWWERWPEAWVGVATGAVSGIIVLDVDIKDPAAYGWDTLDDLGKAILPETPMAQTPSGGTHLYFAAIGSKIGSSIGKHGLGPGLDVRGDGGYVIAPSDGSGYWWDPHYSLDSVPLLPAPAWLGHREKEPLRHRDAKSAGGRRFDAHTVLAEACDNIRAADEGDKHRTVRREAFIAGCLVRDGFLSEQHARHELEAALVVLGRRAQNHNAMVKAYEGAFAEGLAAPSKTGRRA